MKKTRRNIAATATKEYLKKLGVEYVSPDGKTVIVKGEVAKQLEITSGKKKYLTIRLYDPELRMQVPKEERISSTGQISLGVHVINYIWQHDTTTNGLDVDHVDNDPFNNDISNLQLLTRRDNLAKDRKTPLRVVPMPKHIDEETIVHKITRLEVEYEQAKKDHDAKAAHRLRSLLAFWRARHRQFLENPEKFSITKHSEEYLSNCHKRAAKRKELKKAVDEANRFYKEAFLNLGKDDPFTRRCLMDWKMAIVALNDFNDKVKQIKLEKIS